MYRFLILLTLIILGGPAFSQGIVIRNNPEDAPFVQKEVSELNNLIIFDLTSFASGRFGLSYERKLTSMLSIESHVGIRHRAYTFQMDFLTRLNSVRAPSRADTHGAFYEIGLNFRFNDQDLADYSGVGLSIGRHFWPYQDFDDTNRMTSSSLNAYYRFQLLFSKQFALRFQIGGIAHLLRDNRDNVGVGFLTSYQIGLGYFL
jgi:hypothetical protein